MDVMGNSYMPGDPRLVEQIVYELKSQGIFDQFRKECISDVDTKPAYQNLRQRVEGRVTGFLTKQKWKPDMNKNQVREMLRKNIYESGFLETGVNRIVDQVVNPKINTVFHEKVEEIVYKFLGVQKPNTVKEELVVDVEQNDLLPTDLEAVSPDSDHTEKKEECSFDSTDLNDSKNDDPEDESPPFEPLDADENLSFKVHEEHSRDSHMSGFSGLASHDSNHSSDIQIKPSQIEPINQDSRMSLNSSESRLSIVTSEDNSKMDVSDLAVDLKSEEVSNGNLPMDICDNSTSSFEKFNDKKKDAEKQEEKIEDTMTESDNNVNKVTTKEEQENVVNNMENNLNSAQIENENKPETDKNEEVKIEDVNRDTLKDKEATTPKDIKDDTKTDHAKKDNDRKVDIKKEDKTKESSKEKDRKHEKSRDRSDKSSSRHSKDSRSSDKNKHDKKYDEKDKKHSDKDRKSDKEKDKSRHSSSSKDKDKHKERDRKDSRSHSSSSRSEKKSSDKDRSSSKSSSSKEKSRKDSTSTSRDKDKKTSSTSSKKESSSSLQKSKSSRDEKPKSSEKSHRDEKSSTKKEKERKRSSKDDHHSYKEKRSRRSTDRDSDGQSSSNKHSSSQKEATQPKQESSAQNLPSGSSGDSGTSDPVEQSEKVEKVKINKPKFAANIKEAMKLMKIRKQLKRLEKENQISLSEVDYGNTSNEADDNTTNNMNKSDNFKEPKEPDAKTDVDTIESSDLKSEEIKDVEVPLQNVDISQAKWDSLQAKLMLEVTVDYNSYGNSDDEESFNATSVQDSSSIEDVKATTKESTSKTESDKTTDTGKKTDTDKIKSPIKRTKSNAESKTSPRETKSETKETKSPIKRTKSNAESESKSSIELKKKFTTLELENNFNIPTDEKLIQEIKVMLVDVLKPNVANGTLTSPIKPLQEKSPGKCSPPKIQPLEELSNVEDDKSDTEDCCKFLKSPSKTEDKKRKSMNLIIQKLESQISKIIIQIGALKNDSTTPSECKIMVTKRKRQSSEHTDVKNNNKNDLCVVKRTKKADGENLGAKNESGVSEVNGFLLPLSPAESDQSNDVSLNTHNSIVKVEAKTKPKRVPTAKVPKLSQQRYSSEDLYKPRMNFSSRRRSAKNDT